jgi:hypothetical protein
MSDSCALAAGKGQYVAPLTPSLALENEHRFGAAQIAIKALSRSGKVCALCALSALSTCPAIQAIANAGKKVREKRDKPPSQVEARRFSLENGPRCHKILTSKKVAYA